MQTQGWATGTVSRAKWHLLTEKLPSPQWYHLAVHSINMIWQYAPYIFFILAQRDWLSDATVSAVVPTLCRKLIFFLPEALKCPSNARLESGVSCDASAETRSSERGWLRAAMPICAVCVCVNKDNATNRGTPPPCPYQRPACIGHSWLKQNLSLRRVSDDNARIFLLSVWPKQLVQII